MRIAAGRAGVVLALLGAVSVAPAACGGDDEAAPGPGSGADAGGADGTLDDATLDDASPGDGAPGETGPSCTPRSQLPPPVVPDIDLASACSVASTCGGQLDGTSWRFGDTCVPRDVLFPEIRAVCNVSTVTSSVVSESIDGTLAFQSGSMDRKLSMKATLSVTFPNACHACQCTNLESRLVSAGLVSASCSPVCNGGTCTCTVSRTRTYDFTDGYTAGAPAAGSLTTTGGKTFRYCIADGGLSIAETLADGGAAGPSSTIAPGTATLAPPAAFSTPEICDGRDNDGNGVADDALRECPPCKNVGVCAGAFTAECKGAAGWSCTYTSPAYQADETKCDHKDNDCDGLVDEMGGCEEVCDGIDNDGNGVVDDALTDTPPCPTTQGVCTAGAAPTCLGAAGWQCNYKSAAYRAYEACDGVDNDCNGAVDEGCSCPTGSSKLFFATNLGVVKKADLDGQNVATVLDPSLAPDGGGPKVVLSLAVDPLRNVLYFVNDTDHLIERIGLDGSGRTTVYTGATRSIALDVGAAQLYFQGNCGAGALCKLDVSSTSTVGAPVPLVVQTTGNFAVTSLALDPFYRRVYWCGSSTSAEPTLERAELDGTGHVVLVPRATQFVMSIAPDFAHRKLYWGYNSSGASLYVANLDAAGGGTALLPSESYPVALVVDRKDGALFWHTLTATRRAGLDGSGATDIVPGSSYAMDAYICP